MEQEDKLNEFEPKKKSNMRLHLGFTCLGYFSLGIALCVQQFGIKAGFGFYPTLITYISCFLFWIIIVFTSMEKVKEVLYKK